MSDLPNHFITADDWQPVREFLDKESYIQDHHPRIEFHEDCEDDLLPYSVFLILHKWVFQPVLVGADTDTQALLTQLLGSLAFIEPRRGLSYCLSILC